MFLREELRLIIISGYVFWDVVLLLRLLVPTSDILIPVRLRRVLRYYKAKIRWEVFKGVDDIFGNECEMAHVT